MSKVQAREEVIKARAICGEEEYDSDWSILGNEVDDSVDTLNRLAGDGNLKVDPGESIEVKDSSIGVSNESRKLKRKRPSSKIGHDESILKNHTPMDSIISQPSQRIPAATNSNETKGSKKRKVKEPELADLDFKRIQKRRRKSEKLKDKQAPTPTATRSEHKDSKILGDGKFTKRKSQSEVKRRESSVDCLMGNNPADDSVNQLVSDHVEGSPSNAKACSPTSGKFATIQQQNLAPVDVATLRRERKKERRRRKKVETLKMKTREMDGVAETGSDEHKISEDRPSKPALPINHRPRQSSTTPQMKSEAQAPISPALTDPKCEIVQLNDRHLYDSITPDNIKTPRRSEERIKKVTSSEEDSNHSLAKKHIDHGDMGHEDKNAVDHLKQLKEEFRRADEEAEGMVKKEVLSSEKPKRRRKRKSEVEENADEAKENQKSSDVEKYEDTPVKRLGLRYLDGLAGATPVEDVSMIIAEDSEDDIKKEVAFKDCSSENSEDSRIDEEESSASAPSENKNPSSPTSSNDSHEPDSNSERTRNLPKKTPTTRSKFRSAPRKPLPKSSPYFPNSSTPKKKTASSAKKTSCIPFPPLSSPTFGLVQESLAQNPFHLLLATIFLNKTRAAVALPYFHALITRFPTPASLADADVEAVVGFFRHLGLQNQRARTCVMLARTWVTCPPRRGRRWRRLGYPCAGDGRDVGLGEVVGEGDGRVAWEVGHLPGVGAYAIDSWRIFCRDRLRGVECADAVVESAVVVKDEASGVSAQLVEEIGMAEVRGCGERRQVESELEGEWTRVLPLDKELRAYLRWRWLRAGWEWDPITGERKVVDQMVYERALRGGVILEGEAGSVVQGVGDGGEGGVEGRGGILLEGRRVGGEEDGWVDEGEGEGVQGQGDSVSEIQLEGVGGGGEGPGLRPSAICNGVLGGRGDDGDPNAREEKLSTGQKVVRARNGRFRRMKKDSVPRLRGGCFSC